MGDMATYMIAASMWEQDINSYGRKHVVDLVSVYLVAADWYYDWAA